MSSAPIGICLCLYAYRHTADTYCMHTVSTVNRGTEDNHPISCLYCLLYYPTTLNITLTTPIAPPAPPLHTPPTTLPTLHTPPLPALPLPLHLLHLPYLPLPALGAVPFPITLYLYNWRRRGVPAVKPRPYMRTFHATRPPISQCIIYIWPVPVCAR
jgi:hypothetical protein